MALTEQKVKIQMLYPGAVPRIHVMQSDTGRSVVCEITDWTIPSDATAVVWVKKPSGKTVYAAGTIDTDANAVLIDLTNQMIAEEGLTAVDVEVDGADGTMVTAFRFWLCVHEKTGYGEESATELSLLQELIDAAESATAAASAAASSATNAAASANAAASSAYGATTMATNAANAANSAAEAANEAAEEAETVVTRVENLETTVGELESEIDSMGTGSGTLDDINQLGLTEEDGVLYVLDTTTGEHGPEGWPITGTGSGGTSTASTKLKITSGTTATITEEKDYTIAWTFTSVDADGDETGDGTAVLKLNDTVIYTASIAQGTGSYTISADSLVLGSNTVSLSVTDADGNTLTRSVTITVVALSISSSFDDSAVYTGAVTYRYTPVGSGITKTIHFVLDGTEIDTVDVTSSGRQQTYTLAEQSNGAHSLLVYATATIDGAETTSNELYHEIIWADDSAADVIIASSFRSGAEIVEGTVITVPYLVYDPSATTAAVTREILDSSGEVYSVASATVDRTMQYWTINDYPSGTITLRLTSGEAVKTITIVVAASDLDVEATTTTQVYYLTAMSRTNSDDDKESADYGDVTGTLSNFNFASDGWQGTTLRFQGDDLLEIGYMPFSSDVRSTGFTAEFEFTTIAVRDKDAVIISCMSGGRGFKITPQSATICTEQSEKTIYFMEGARTRITISAETTSEDRMVRLCVNGVPYGVFQYPTGDNFQQSSPVNITIGNDDCSFDLHTVRIHTSSLTDSERIGNWIYDRDTYTERAELAAMNDIYDDYGALDASKIEMLLPVMYATGAKSTGKKDYQDIVVDYVYASNTAKSFTDSLAYWYVQGTSSVGFPVKNYRIQLSESYKLYDNLADQTLYCIKANFMDSSNACNTGSMNMFNYIYRQMGYLTPPMEEDENIRMCIAGYPFILFQRDTDSDDYEFSGIYTFNYDKGSGTEALYGADEESWPGVQWWEFGNNTSAHCLFQSSEIDDDISTDLEVRYGEEDWSIISSAIQFVIDCNGDPDAFLADVESYFDLDFLVAYYVLSMTLGSSDSRAKNMVMGCWPSVSKKLYALWYDHDTLAGRNNEGLPEFPYDMEAHSQYGTSMAFNGEESELWKLVEEACADQIKSVYQTMRNKGYLSLDTIKEYMIEPFYGSIPASLYVEDGVYKYEKPTLEDGDDQLVLEQGDWAMYFLRWMTYSFAYRDSKYGANDFTDDRISLRVYAPTTDNITDATTRELVTASLEAVPPDQDFDITCDIHMFPEALYGANGYEVQEECEEGGTVHLTAPSLSNFNDLETYLMGAKWLTDIGDLSAKYPGSVNLSAGTILRSAYIGSRTEGYYNTNLTSATFGNNYMLETVVLSNCPNLTGSIDLSNCPAMEEFYAEGTAITSVSFSNGGRLKICYLPETITSLVFQNQPMIEELVVANYSNITSLRVENCATLDTLALVNACENLDRVRLTDVDWTLTDSSLLLALAEIGGMDASGTNTDVAVITGKVYIDQLSPTGLANITAAFPELTVTYGTEVPDYTVTFYDEDGTTVLYTETVPLGGNGWDPVASGDISAPTKDSTVNTVFTFSGWSGSWSYVTSDVSIIAVYAESVRTYTVSYYNGSTLLQATEVEVYGSCDYEGDDIYKTGYIWIGWDDAASYVISDMTINAVFEQPSLPSEVKDLDEYDYAYSDIDGETSAYTFAELYAIIKTGQAETYLPVTSKIHIDLSESTLTNDTDIEMNVHSFGHYELADGSGMSNVDFYMTGLLVSARQMNSSSTNAGGWDESALRKWLNERFYPSLPIKWRQLISLSITLANAGSQTTTITASEDYLRIMSTSEVGFDTSAVPYCNEVSSEASEVAFSQYTSASSRIKKTYNGAGVAQNYWLRSADSGSTPTFRSVTIGGYSNSGTATYSYYVCLGFSA